jgi:phage terminase large subunit
VPVIETIPQFLPLFDESHPAYHARYLDWHGGRGAAKSWQVAAGLVMRATKQKKRILCAREFQNSISESVHTLLEETIDRLGLGYFFDVQSTMIKGANDSEFLYRGLRHNLTSIKSFEGADIVWIEEAQTMSERSWRILPPTIRKPGSQIVLTWNPDQESDPTYQRIIVKPPANMYSCEVNWRDNPWFTAELEAERAEDERRDPDAYQHVWEGKPWSRSDAQILHGKWRVEDFEPQASWNGPYHGADWGFAQDPTTLIRCWEYKNVLYISHEAYKIGLELDDTGTYWKVKVPGCERYVIRADNARPESISHVKKARLNPMPKIEAVTKWSGSVEDGIAHLRSYDAIVIHPRCKYTAQEARLYSYKVDKLTNEVQPDVVDKHNHTWDAVRYALNPIIQANRKRAGLIA